MVSSYERPKKDQVPKASIKMALLSLSLMPQNDEIWPSKSHSESMFAEAGAWDEDLQDFTQDYTSEGKEQHKGEEVAIKLHQQ